MGRRRALRRRSVRESIVVVVGWVDDQGGVAGVPVGESYGVVVGASGDAKTGYVSVIVIGSALL